MKVIRGDFCSTQVQRSRDQQTERKRNYSQLQTDSLLSYRIISKILFSDQNYVQVVNINVHLKL